MQHPSPPASGRYLPIVPSVRKYWWQVSWCVFMCIWVFTGVAYDCTGGDRYPERCVCIQGLTRVAYDCTGGDKYPVRFTVNGVLTRVESAFSTQTSLRVFWIYLIEPSLLGCICVCEHTGRPHTPPPPVATSRGIVNVHQAMLKQVEHLK